MQSSVIRFPHRNAMKPGGVSKVPAYVRSLADGLMWTLQVREGVEMVPLLGYGNEYSNRRAIETWLMTRYDLEYLVALDEPLETLSKALKRHIEDYSENLEVHTC